MALGKRLRAIWSAAWGGTGAGSWLVPWHLRRDGPTQIVVNAETALTLTSVYKACALLSDAATSAPAILFSRPQSGGRVVDVSSAAARALATIPHADMECFAHHTALGGNGFLRIYRDGTGAPASLRAVPAYLVSLEIEQGTGSLWYRVQPNPFTFEPEALVPSADMVHAKYRATSNPLWGVPPMVSCSPAFAQALRARSVQTYLYQNLASPGMVLIAPGKMDADVARRLQGEFDQSYRGSGTGKTAVLANGLDVKSIVWSASDQQLLEQIQASVQDVARAYSVPQYFLEHVATTTYASASEAGRALYASAQRPFTLRLADALAEKLVSRADRAAGAGIELDLSKSLILPGKELSDYVGGLVTAGICTPNEVRNDLGLVDLANGDTLRTPTHAPQAAKMWEYGRAYPAGTFVCHDSGLWQRSAVGADEEPAADCIAWNCVAPGIKSVEMSDGSLTVEMTSGFLKTMEVTK